tara:strand:+ start:108 stop:593 length:486 start_codon:yes stop_codon:yes gene_type:complete
MNDTLNYLKQIPGTDTLHGKDLSRVADLFETRVFKAGKTIIKEGRTTKEIFILVEGRVAVTQRLGDKVVPHFALDPIRMIGGFDCRTTERSLFTVSAIQTTICLTLKHEILQDTRIRVPDEIFQVRKILYQQLNRELLSYADYLAHIHKNPTLITKAIQKA